MKSYPVQVLFREYFEGLLAAVFLALFLRFFVLSILYIPTDNMEPNLQRGDFIIGWRISYGFPLPLMKGERLNFKPPARGDIISFRFPGDEEQLIIRRVMALPGDEVEIREGKVFINGQPLKIQEAEEGLVQESFSVDEPGHQVLGSPRSNLSPFKIPEGHIFVLSDNRKRSDDSRDWGTVPFNNIESRLGFIWLSMTNREDGLQFLWDRMFTWVD